VNHTFARSGTASALVVLLAGCSGASPSAAGGSAAAPAAAKAESALSEPERKLLSNLRFAIEIDAQPAFAGIEPEDLVIEQGRLVVRGSAAQIADAYALCDSLLASSGGYGKLTHTQIFVDGRLAADSVFGADGSAGCETR
jgi:hypothetical protein